MDALSKIFGSALRVKILRLFLNNSSEFLSASEVSSKIKASHDSVNKELSLLNKSGMLNKRKAQGKTNTYEYFLNNSFIYKEGLRRLLVDTSPIDTTELSKQLRKAGKVTVVLVSNVLAKDWEERADILIVGDNLNAKTVDSVMKSLEANMGREIKYALFSTPDFKYRINMYDRLVRDVLDYPHQRVVDKIGLPDML